MFNLFSSNKKTKVASKALAKRAGSASSNANTRQFSAVRIITQDRAPCNAVKNKLNQVYLGSEAPLLPLPECSQQAICRCRYQHLSDRRAIARRESDNGLPDRLIDVERRAIADRRRQAGSA
jgi:hypothetical protein